MINHEIAPDDYFKQNELTETQKAESDFIKKYANRLKPIIKEIKENVPTNHLDDNPELINDIVLIAIEGDTFLYDMLGGD